MLPLKERKVNGIDHSLMDSLKFELNRAIIDLFYVTTLHCSYLRAIELRCYLKIVCEELIA